MQSHPSNNQDAGYEGLRYDTTVEAELGFDVDYSISESEQFTAHMLDASQLSAYPTIYGGIHSSDAVSLPADTLYEPSEFDDAPFASWEPGAESSGFSSFVATHANNWNETGTPSDYLNFDGNFSYLGTSENSLSGSGYSLGYPSLPSFTSTNSLLPTAFDSLGSLHGVGNSRLSETETPSSSSTSAVHTRRAPVSTIRDSGTDLAAGLTAEAPGRHEAKKITFTVVEMEIIKAAGEYVTSASYRDGIFFPHPRKTPGYYHDKTKALREIAKECVDMAAKDKEILILDSERRAAMSSRSIKIMLTKKSAAKNGIRVTVAVSYKLESLNGEDQIRIGKGPGQIKKDLISGKVKTYLGRDGRSPTYIYGVDQHGNTYPYINDCARRVLNAILFPKGGPARRGLLNEKGMHAMGPPYRLTTIAFAFFLIRHCLTEWEGGSHRNVTLESIHDETVYDSILKDIERCASTPGVGLIMSETYRRWWDSSVSALDLPAATHSAHHVSQPTPAA